MRKYLFTVFACALAAGASLLPAQALHAETKPIAAVAIKSYNELLSNIKYVGEIAEKPELGSAFEGLLALGTQGMGLAGIDKSRPWGFVIQANGDDITGYAFLPLSDGKALVKLLGLYTTVSNEQGLYKFTPKDGKQAFYGKAQGKWAVFSDKPASLKTTAPNPASLLAGADKKHLVTGRVFLSNVPEKFRQMAIDKIEEGAKADLDKKADEPEDLHTVRTKASEKIVEAVKTAINNMDQITAGWGLDRTAETLFAELNFTAVSGTPLAEQMASLEKSTSKFAGLELPGQAASAHIAAPITEMKAAVLNSIIALARKQALVDAEKKNPEENQELSKGLINNVADLLQKIVKGGQFDLAASVKLEPEAALGMVAANVADGPLLDKTLRTVAEAVKSNLPPLGDMIKLDADSIGPVKLHTVTIPLGPDTKDREKAVRIFGEEIHFVVGVGADTAYVAAGRDALETLKKAITDNTSGDKSISPVDVTVSGEKVAAFSAVNGEEKDHEKMKIAAEELKQTPGKDHVTLVAKAIPNGVQYRLAVEKGLLRAAVKMSAEGKN